MKDPRAAGSLYFLLVSNNHSILPDRVVHHSRCLHTGRGLIFSAVAFLCFCWKRLLFVEVVGWWLGSHIPGLGHRPGRRSLEAAAPPFWKSVAAASRGGRRSAHPSQRGLQTLGLAPHSVMSTWPRFSPLNCCRRIASRIKSVHL